MVILLYIVLFPVKKSVRYPVLPGLSFNVLWVLQLEEIRRVPRLERGQTEFSNPAVIDPVPYRHRHLELVVIVRKLATNSGIATEDQALLK